MRVALDYVPLPVNYGFHTGTSYERSLFGGYGSGKSVALCAEALAVGLEQPGSEILICRKTIPALRDTTEATFTSLIPPDLWKQCETSRMGNHFDRIILPNGSKYLFRGLDDWRKLKSLNVAFIFYDECDEIDEETYVGMMSRVRQTQPLPGAKAQGAGPITRRGIVSASNPAGHNWLWKRFVSPEAVANSTWFKSTSLDNPHLPLDYINSLLAMPDPWVRRYVLCDFDEFGGQIYGDWGYDSHVIDPYRDGRYPVGSFAMQLFDPGTSAGNASLWVVWDPDRRLHVGVAEYNETGLSASKHAAEWRRIEAKHKLRPRVRLADPKAIPVRDRGSNMSLRDQYRRLGFHFGDAANSVESRIWALGELITQGRFKLTRDCPMTHEQLLNYRWEDLTPDARAKGKEAKPLKKNVDLVDCAQYAACRFTKGPDIGPDDGKTDEEAYADEVRKTIRRQLATRTATRAHDLGSIAL